MADIGTTNAAANEYNYQTGSGMDSFLGRSLDEVSWQNTLASSYNTLSTLPIGTSASTATPTNYDTTQISGSSSGTTSVGGSDGSGSSAGLQINATDGNITLSDGTNNRLLLGFSQGGF